MVACYQVSSFTQVEKTYNNMMFVALGNTWRYDFNMGMQNDMNL